MAQQETDSADQEAGRAGRDIVQHWLDQHKAYDQEFDPWVKRCDKIIKRYRAERDEKNDGTNLGGTRFNALWSNVQTLMPAVYIKAPQPVVERRFLDKDKLGRFSSMTLERALEVQIEVGKTHPATRKALLDWLLCGRGTMWERYEPTYGEPEDIGPAVQDNESTDPKADAGEAPRPVTYEKVCTDYVSWKKFRHSPAATWDEVWWVSKEEGMTRKELQARFKGKDEATGKPIADLVPLQSTIKDPDRTQDKDKKKRPPQARVWEIWDKTNRKVIFVAPDWPHGPLEETDDPLHLESFWPCPDPIYATTTNETLVPVPDYAEYVDQADEIDDITARISALTSAIRVNGVYDASYPELKRILQEGVDNRMIGVKNWSELASKGGLEGAMSFVPVKDVVEALLRLYEARERVKADMAEITGISDIVRGQAQGGGAKTATEQRIKGQFATLRLEDRKKEVARFLRDDMLIKAEIISEQFSPETLAEMTGMLAVISEEIANEAPTQPAQSPMMGHNGGPPLEAATGASPPPVNGAPGGPTLPAAAGQQPMPQPMPQPDPQAMAMQLFGKACELLKSDKMRTFRIDIETDSTIEVDKQEAKEAVVELFTAMGGFLEKALMAGQMEPALAPALGQSMLFAFRRFGAGRDVEGAWEQAIDKIVQKSKNPQPKPPSPEEIKAQAEIQKQQMENQRMQQQAQVDQQKAAQEMQAAQQKNALEMQKMQAELQMQREEMNMMREKMGLELQAKQQETMLDAQAAERDAALDERSAIREHELAEASAEREAEAGERDFELQRKTAEFKAKEAMKPKPKGGK